VPTRLLASPLGLGCAVAGLTVLLWQFGAMVPWHPQPTTSLDLQWYFFGVYEAFFGTLRAGQPMLWNPYQLCGIPWLGTLQGGFFYPPHLVYLFLPTPWGIAVCTVLHLALAAAATAVFARRAGLSVAASALAALLFAIAGPLASLQLWPYLLEASAWLPVGALAILDLTGDRPRRATIGLALASGMSWLAGSPQATAMVCYVWGALLLARLLAARPPIGVVVRALLCAAVGLAMGLLLAAVALLPAFELAGEGVRHMSTLDTTSMYPLGIPTARGVWSIWLQTGSRALLLAGLGLAPLALLPGRSPFAAWGVAVAVLAGLAALGPSTPFFELYARLPLLGWFRAPYRALIVGQFGFAIAAGLGLDAAARRVRWRPLGAVVLLGLLTAVTVEGLRSHRAHPPFYDASWRPFGPVQYDAYRRLATMANGERIWGFSPGLGTYALYPKLPTLARVRSIDDYEPLALRRQHEYFVFFAEGISRPTRGSENALVRSLAVPPGIPPAATRRRLLDLAALRFMVTLPPTQRRPDVAAFLRDSGLVSRPSLGDGLLLYENPYALPRAFVTYRATEAPPAAALLPALARASFDPLVESFVEGPGLPSPEGAPARGAPATIVRDDPDVVEIDATLAVPGLVVLADTYYPGWTATVDGAPAPILATNHLFRGVPAPAGAHRIRFAYRPRSLALGAALSLLTALALAAGAYRVAPKTDAA
jgi:hypothetical protein